MRKPSQKLVNILSKITYKDVYLYRYLSETLNIFESPAEIEGNSCFNHIYPDSFESNIDIETASSSINSFLSSLSQKQILFSSAPIRKMINDKMVHTVLDPYIDVIPIEDYISIEFFHIPDGDKPYSFHTKNIHFYYTDYIWINYGITHIDKKDFYDFLDTCFFPVIEQEENVSLYEIQKNNIRTHLYYCLSIRSAYIQFYTDVLDIVSPRVICYSHGAHQFMCFLYEAASVKGIPCLEVAHGADCKTRFFQNTISHNTFYLTYSDLCASISKANGVTNVIPIGKPSVNETNKPLSPINKIIVCVISSCEGDLLSIAALLSKMLPSSTFAVAYKLHSAEKWNSSFETQLSENFPNLNLLSPQLDVNVLYEKTSIVIGERSTALLEALPFEYIKILIHNRNNDTNFENNGTLSFFNNLIENNEMIRTFTIDDIIAEILKYNTQESYRPNGEIFWKTNAKENFRNFIYQF